MPRGRTLLRTPAAAVKSGSQMGSVFHDCTMRILYSPHCWGISTIVLLSVSNKQHPSLSHLKQNLFVALATCSLPVSWGISVPCWFVFSHQDSGWQSSHHLKLSFHSSQSRQKRMWEITHWLLKLPPGRDTKNKQTKQTLTFKPSLGIESYHKNYEMAIHQEAILL